MNEPVNEEQINQAIAKVAGGDPAYADQLKKHVANFIGYSNMVAQMPSADSKAAIPKMGGGVAEGYLREKMTPSGVNSAVGSGIDLLNKETNYLQQLAKKSKASGANGDVYNRLSSFKAEDALDKRIQSYMTNPRNSDGTYKTLDQLKQELEGAPLGEGSLSQWKPEDVAGRIAQRIPEALQEDLQASYYESLGYTANEAENLIKYDRYAKGEMSQAEEELYRVTDPGFATKADTLKQNPGLQTDLDKLQANSSDALTFKELKDKYPSIQKESVQPYYERAALDDINQLAQEKGLSAVTQDPETGETVVQPLDVFLEAEATQDIKQLMTLVYQGVLTAAEVDYLLYQVYLQDTAAFQQ